MSDSSIMSVKELIEAAFGDPDKNVVNFKSIETILFIISRQLRILERRVAVVYGENVSPTSKLSVTEVKMHAKKDKPITMGEKTGKTLKDKSKIKDYTNTGKSTKNSADLKKNTSAIHKVAADYETQKRGKGSRDRDSTKSKKLIHPYEDENEIDFSKPSKKSASSYKDDGDEKEFSEEKKQSAPSDRDDEDHIFPKSKKSNMSEKEKKYEEERDGSFDIDYEDRITSKSKKSVRDKIDDGSGYSPKSKKEEEDGYSSKSNKYDGDGYSSKSKKQTQKPTVSERDSLEDVTKRSSIKPKKTTSAKKSQQKKFQGLSKSEEMVEKELRTINQRADSREEPDLNPRPMTKMTESEIQREKLLIVERRPSHETRQNEDVSANLSIVTQEQFDELVREVHELEASFGPINVPEFPENAQLMRELRESASLTDAMAALQLSARLEAAEKTLEKMIDVVTELAQTTPGVDLQEVACVTVEGPNDEKEKTDASDVNVTNAELKSAMDTLYQQIMKDLNAANARAQTTAETAIQTAKKLEEKLDTALELEDRMDELDGLVSEYTERITTMDTGVSSQMAAYQDQLAQMHYDLEVGMDAMAESLANTGGDPAAVAELNAKLNCFQMDLENTAASQKELKELQCLFSVDLETLYKHIEVINETKCDRDEVVDALQDKIGLADLNGRVRQDEFDAVRGDFEKRIADAFNKFNNQEIVWQKIIDEIIREINEKVDEVQMVALRDQINQHLNVLNDKYEQLSAIVGEPRAAAISRQIFREGNCLSCSTPAQLNDMTRPPGDGVESHSPRSEGGDHAAHKPCVFGQPIPHPIDPRAFFCQRYCGGAHTVSSAGDRVPHGLLGKPLSRPTGAILGSDGKAYASDDPEMVPCRPCNVHRPCVCNLEPPVESAAGNVDKGTTNFKKSSFQSPSDLSFMQRSGGSNSVMTNSLVPPSL